MIDKLPGPRRLAIVGGRLERDNDAVFEEMRRLSNGRIAVLATASDVPEEVGGNALEDFLSQGFDASLVPLFWGDRESTAFDAQISREIERYGSVFFTGGDQARIMDTLVQNGVETPVLKTIRERHAAGALIAGSSAGAAVMSESIILGGGSLESLTCGVAKAPDRPGLKLGAGLGFFPWGIVDQHFIKRGRIGRLLVALRTIEADIGFGIDENTALFVEADRAWVLGETGVVVLDMRRARPSVDGVDIKDIRISYLDDGDQYDLRRTKALPHTSKKRFRVSKSSCRTPAPVQRNAFGAYALHDLLIRLVRGDPEHYLSDAASAQDIGRRSEITVRLERVPRSSRALRAERDGKYRYSAIDFRLHVSRRAASGPTQRVQPTAFIRPAPSSRLLLLGNAPSKWAGPAADALLSQLPQPVGVMAIASARPRRVAEEYVAWLSDQGLDADDLAVNAWNIEARSRDRRFLKNIGRMGSLLFTGGDQRRLAETLIYRGEPTPVFLAIKHAYEHGMTLIGVGGAAAAFGTRMIVEGTSCEALRHGASEDAGYDGVVIEEGLGLFNLGLVDQNFMRRRRLGRLLVACAEEGFRYGFGLCEESGMLVTGHGRRARVFGTHGVVVAALDRNRLDIEQSSFAAQGIELQLVQPGELVDLERGIVEDTNGSGAAADAIEKLVADLVRDCSGNGASESSDETDHWLQLALTRGRPAYLDVRSRRSV